MTTTHTAGFKPPGLSAAAASTGSANNEDQLPANGSAYIGAYGASTTSTASLSNSAVFRSGMTVPGLGMVNGGNGMVRMDMSALGGGGAVSKRLLTAAAPLHDATRTDAVVLNAAEWAGGKGLRQGRLVTPVVVDPYLARHLR